MKISIAIRRFEDRVHTYWRSPRIVRGESVLTPRGSITLSTREFEVLKLILDQHPDLYEFEDQTNAR